MMFSKTLLLLTVAIPTAFGETTTFADLMGTTTTDAQSPETTAGIVGGTTAAPAGTTSAASVAGTSGAGFLDGTTTTAELAPPDIVKGSFTIDGVNYDKMNNDTALRISVENACRSAIATHAGVPSSTVDIELSPGSVQVEYSIVVPTADSAQVLFDLTSAVSDGNLTSALVTHIDNIPDIDSVIDGTIGISQMLLPIVSSSVITDTEHEEGSSVKKYVALMATIVTLFFCCCVGMFVTIVVFSRRTKPEQGVLV